MEKDGDFLALSETSIQQPFSSWITDKTTHNLSSLVTVHLSGLLSTSVLAFRSMLMYLANKHCNCRLTHIISSPALLRKLQVCQQVKKDSFYYVCLCTEEIYLTNLKNYYRFQDSCYFFVSLQALVQLPTHKSNMVNVHCIKLHIHYQKIRTY